MTAQGWWILGGILLAALQLFALFLCAKFEDESPVILPKSASPPHVRIVHKKVA